MVIALADVGPADRCGGKAAALGALIRAGLPVPDGFAIAGDASTPEPALDAEVRARAAALGRLAVRSSMSIEDAAGSAGAGVFASLVDVPAAEVWDAIRAVRDSARTPIALAYARGRAIDVGVIVQRFVPGPRITIYTRAPGAPTSDEIWIGEARTTRADRDPRVVLAVRAEAAIGADAGADVELVEGDGGLVVVQARPIVHPSPRTRLTPPPALFAFTRATPGVVWRWDAAHNPSPLSPAQTELVERVDEAGAAPYRMRVVAGYLYATRGPDTAPAADARSLRAIVEDALARALACLTPAASVDDAVAAYVAFYRIWAREAGPPIAATRRALAAELPADDPAWHPRGTITARLAAGDLDALRALAPAWDVAAPTLDERPAWLAAARSQVSGRPERGPAGPESKGRPERGPAGPESKGPRRALAATVAELAEADDLAFARAQAHVRRALLDLAARRGLDPDDVAWLPIDDHAHALDPIAAHARASAARAAAARAARWAMPLAVVDGAPVEVPHAQGRGFGGRATGRVVAIADLADVPAIPPGAVLVVPAVTPALALFAQTAAAIVAEHGGPLDHGAALARELGIPYVITPGATTAFASGAAVVVDGDAGTVTPA